MNISCPYCQNKIVVKEAKAGRYGPKCVKCGKKFALTVHDDANKPPTVSAIKSETSVEETMPPPKPSIPAGETQPVHPAEVEGTGAWSTQSPSNLEATTPPPSAAPSNESTGAWATQAAGQSDQTMAHSADAPTRAGATAVGAAAVTAAGGAKSQPTRMGGTESVAGPPDGMPSHLGGYQLIKELGRGGMGSVYLAKQLSLDRDVALKVMQPQWARDPVFVARFTREAYAAAQLVHHNVVQIYDIGAQRDLHFFSMEFVKGQSLRDLVTRDGKLDIEVAVGYTLQAARGLKFAHDQGLIHRDVKPDNLMLNDQGIVKVADLGLVKRAGTADLPTGGNGTAAEKASAMNLGAAGDITMANVAMGTPAYMSPEQSQDAANVDHRADIYSLGCSLYVLVTGRPPFQGTTAFEVMSKHKTEPMVPPEVLVKRVPKDLSAIILKMTAKRADDRYAHLGECIVALEKFLGVQSSGPFTPKEEHANVLEDCVKRFNASAAARLKPMIGWGFFGACLVIALVCGLFGIPLLSFGFLALGGIAAVAATIISGQMDRTHLFLKFRELLLGSSWGDRVIWLLGLILFLGLLVVFNLSLLWMFLGFAVLAVLLALAFQFTINRKAAAERAGPVEETEKMLRSMRLLGLEEPAIQQFVCKYSGEHWEAFFEALFGYEAKMIAREQWGRSDRGRARPKSGAWREPIIRWIESRQRKQREARERKHLQGIEEQGLKAKGMSASEARAQAEAAAGALIQNAADLKRSAAEGPKGGESAEARKNRIKSMLEAARTGQEKPLSTWERLERGVLGTIVGYRTRLALGLLLIVGCVMWMNQNGLIPGKELKALTEQSAIEKGDVKSVLGTEEAKAVASGWLENYKKAAPLRLPVVGGLFNSFNPAIAGIFLILSAFTPGLRIALLMFPAVLVTLFGSAFIPGGDLVLLGVGAGLCVAALLFGRGSG